MANEEQNERTRSSHSLVVKLIVIAAIVAAWALLAVLFGGQ